jgi:hypothetical protein
LTIAYLAQGRLRLKCGDLPARTVESKYGNDIREKSVRAAQRHQWKTQGAGDKFLSGSMLWGKAASDPAAIPIRLTSVGAGPVAGQLCYTLESDSLCAILRVDGLGEEEQRLWNNNSMFADRISYHPEAGHLACSIRHRHGTANLAVMMSGNTGLQEITEGDSVDTAPSWMPGEGNRLIYQSAGVGRNRDGEFAALGPFSIQQMDLDLLELTTVIENPSFDFVLPRVAPDGSLYCIRRPYQASGSYHFGHALKDVVLFPFRLLRAIFSYLNFFSMLYSGKKLSTAAGGTPAKEMDMKEMLIWGRRVEAAKAAKADESSGLVPKDWVLIRVPKGGATEQIASGVLAYDVAPDGTVIFTNGSAVFRAGPDGSKREKLVSEAMIEQVIVLKDGAPAAA